MQLTQAKRERTDTIFSIFKRVMKTEAAGTSETSADYTVSLATRQFSQSGFFSDSLEFRAPL